MRRACPLVPVSGRLGQRSLSSSRDITLAPEQGSPASQPSLSGVIVGGLCQCPSPPAPQHSLLCRLYWCCFLLPARKPFWLQASLGILCFDDQTGFHLPKSLISRENLHWFPPQIFYRHVNSRPAACFGCFTACLSPMSAKDHKPPARLSLPKSGNLGCSSLSACR